MAEAHQKFFPGVPVVFCGSSEELAGNPKLDSSFTGIWEGIDPAKTIDVALKLEPETSHLFVVGGTATFDTRVEAIASRDLQPYEGRLDITYLTNLDMPTLLDRLKTLPKHSIVLFTRVSRGRGRTPFHRRNAICSDGGCRRERSSLFFGGLNCRARRSGRLCDELSSLKEQSQEACCLES